MDSVSQGKYGIQQGCLCETSHLGCQAYYSAHLYQPFHSHKASKGGAYVLYPALSTAVTINGAVEPTRGVVNPKFRVQLCTF